MSVNFTNKPNYFFFAQALINFLQGKIQSGVITDSRHSFALATIYETFGQDLAASTANLDGILNIADNYYAGDDPQQKLIEQYRINAESNQIEFIFNEATVNAIKYGAELHAPDPTLYE
ncbi:hypothetical protein F4V57_05850 [Acinetobacter qingfengensis]|uniref:Uncharacterized protein n=2 Tax=Acinetobacter qingfengensis TaxID=1262585 RepID=A0A1E7RDV2_9GAMM|nr:hypothetical protein [Acinetobacter qingfengensis]KAA8734480.1 hypothetical protein F4V57_05850 [Acinetobacter qingfengensis]OEY97518.1 hypothetical protein BJI46_09180 [Acinetobacter qingfengensis]